MYAPSFDVWIWGLQLGSQRRRGSVWLAVVGWRLQTLLSQKRGGLIFCRSSRGLLIAESISQLT